MCNFLNYFSMLAVSAKPDGNTRRSPTECPPAPTCSEQRACGSAGASYALTVQWRSDDMKNPDSTGQQRPTILAGCVEILGLAGNQETKVQSSRPARTSVLEMPLPNCPQPHFSQRAQEFKFHCKSPENSAFPKTLKSSNSSLNGTCRENASVHPYVPLPQNHLSPSENRKLAVTHCPLASTTYTVTLRKKRVPTSLLSKLQTLWPAFMVSPSLTASLICSDTDWVAHEQQKFVSCSSGS